MTPAQVIGQLADIGVRLSLLPDDDVRVNAPSYIDLRPILPITRQYKPALITALREQLEPERDSQDGLPDSNLWLNLDVLEMRVRELTDRTTDYGRVIRLLVLLKHYEFRVIKALVGENAHKGRTLDSIRRYFDLCCEAAVALSQEPNKIWATIKTEAKASQLYQERLIAMTKRQAARRFCGSLDESESDKIYRSLFLARPKHS